MDKKHLSKENLAQIKRTIGLLKWSKKPPYGNGDLVVRILL